MLTLYGFDGSGSAAVEMALKAADLPYHRIDAATWESTSALDALRKVNPLVQIPALVFPGGAVMTESAAILIDLGLSCTPGLLLPKDEADRAQSVRGLVFIAANCYSAISISDYPERWTTGKSGKAREALRAGTRKQLHRHWEIFADTFAARPFLGGAAPGALDFLAVVVSKWSGTRGYLEAHRPEFHETLQRIESHESVARVMQCHWPT